MKHWIAICALAISGSAVAQCPDYWTQDHFQAYIDATAPDSIGRRQLKQHRQTYRLDKNAYMEMVTHRLEYWAKDFGRYVKRYRAANADAVCARIERDKDYQHDYFEMAYSLSAPPKSRLKSTYK